MKVSLCLVNLLTDVIDQRMASLGTILFMGASHLPLDRMLNLEGLQKTLNPELRSQCLH